jgi:hypothetical protein
MKYRKIITRAGKEIPETGLMNGPEKERIYAFSCLSLEEIF